LTVFVAAQTGVAKAAARVTRVNNFFILIPFQ